MTMPTVLDLIPAELDSIRNIPRVRATAAALDQAVAKG